MSRVARRCSESFRGPIVVWSLGGGRRCTGGASSVGTAMTRTRCRSESRLAAGSSIHRGEELLGSDRDRWERPSEAMPP